MVCCVCTICDCNCIFVWNFGSLLCCNCSFLRYCVILLAFVVTISTAINRDFLSISMSCKTSQVLEVCSLSKAMHACFNQWAWLNVAFFHVNLMGMLKQAQTQEYRFKSRILGRARPYSRDPRAWYIIPLLCVGRGWKKCERCLNVKDTCEICNVRYDATGPRIRIKLSNKPSKI